jgi:hypothetical protein
MVLATNGIAFEKYCLSWTPAEQGVKMPWSHPAGERTQCVVHDAQFAAHTIGLMVSALPQRIGRTFLDRLAARRVSLGRGPTTDRNHVAPRRTAAAPITSLGTPCRHLTAHHPATRPVVCPHVTHRGHAGVSTKASPHQSATHHDVADGVPRRTGSIAF